MTGTDLGAGAVHLGRITRATPTGPRVAIDAAGGAFELAVVAWPRTAALTAGTEVVVVFRTDGEAVIAAELTTIPPP